MDDNAAADMAPATEPAVAAAPIEEAAGAADPAAAADGDLVSKEKGAGSDDAVPAQQNGEAHSFQCSMRPGDRAVVSYGRSFPAILYWPPARLNKCHPAAHQEPAICTARWS